MSLGAQYYVMEAAYSLPKLNDYVDYFITLAYDYHGVWDGVVNANAPLNSLNKDDVFSVVSIFLSQILHTCPHLKLA